MNMHFGLLTILGMLAATGFQSLEVRAEEAKLPRQPWHTADIWWNFAEKTPHFESLDIDVTIDRDVSTNVNLYIAPCGLGQLSGVDFYGGLQSNVNGWEAKTNQTRVHIGKGGIFSRWGHKSLSVDQARGAPDSRFEAAGYEGDFVSVRRPLVWNKGTYTWSLRACDTETVGTNVYTWISCFIRSHETGLTRYIGSLRFEGTDLTFWPRHAAFVEVYSTAKIPKSEIPEVKVTFGYPRINGRAPKLQSASVNHPGPGEPSASPDCASAIAEGENVVVTLGPIFERDPKQRRHALALTPPEH